MMSQRITRRSAAKQVAQVSPTQSFKEPVQLSSPPQTPIASRGKSSKITKGSSSVTETPPKNSRKRARNGAVKDETSDELPHNLNSIPERPSKALKSENGTPLKKTSPKKPRKSNNSANKSIKNESVEELAGKVVATADPSPKKTKNNSYGLTPGQSPYPNWPHPTASECEEVTRLLSTVHGKVTAPKTIPTPSLTVSGCGEVPSVLDALIRTRLSAATNANNSSRAFAGLVSNFGILKTGVGKGSVDWNKVRLADTKDVFEAIKCGGLADVKSKDIKKILQMVWEENQERREALVSSKEAPGTVDEDPQEKTTEVEKAEKDVLSLDHLHLLSNDEAFSALTKYPGIGPKTASCVLLFCLQRPSFAVDTHVFRLSQWLGWVPPPGDPAGLAPGSKGKFSGPTRNSTYAHLDVRIPDDLKYPLHYLFIKHGRTCPRCRAITGEGSEGWEKGCVIDHLVQRSGDRKGANASPVKSGNKRKKSASKKKDDTETEAESDDFSDSGSDYDGKD